MRDDAPPMSRCRHYAIFQLCLRLMPLPRVQPRRYTQDGEMRRSAAHMISPPQLQRCGRCHGSSATDVSPAFTPATCRLVAATPLISDVAR